MSHRASDPSEGSQDGVKKKRLRGSCDECRRRKAKCDSAQMPGRVCSACIAAKIECHHDFSNRVKPTYEYTQSLEAKIAKFEEFFRRTRPGEDIDEIINSTSGSPVGKSVGAQIHTDDSDSSEDNDGAVAALLSGLRIKHDRKFFGQSSAFSFAQTASSTGRNPNGGSDTLPDPGKYRRPFFWETTPWEVSFALSSQKHYVYPDGALLMSLVSLYFEKMNYMLPVLHQPTFMRSLLKGQHYHDPSFGMTVLVVCAIGSRYSQDPRVLVPDDSSGMSAGWNYFSQIPTHRKLMSCESSNIHDLQYYALAALYLNGSSNPNSAWHMVGVGLRYAIEKGAHRRKGQNYQPNADDELQKRAFWVIVCLDRIISAFVGRPYGYPHELIQVEYPVECDDEYWETDDPTQAFKQPPGKPCTVTAFVLYVKLCNILGFATGIIYSSKKCKRSVGFVGDDGEETMIAGLDSSMNKWKDSLPEYLVWDPHRQNAFFFHQSSNIHALFYYIQIQIHRPFLTKKSSLSFVSLAMCTNAARSCSRVLEASITRGFRVSPNTLASAFTAGLFLVFALRNRRASDISGGRQEDLENLQRCINALKECEKKRWHPGGRLVDMLMEAGSVTQYEPSGTNKRRRQSLDSEATSGLPSHPLPPVNTTADLGSFNGTESDNQLSSELMNAYEMTAPMNNWDLHRLLLMDTGHSFMQIDALESMGAAFYGGYVDSMQPVHKLASTDYAPEGTGGAGSNVVLPEGPDMFTWWPEDPTTLESFEQWEANISSGGQQQMI